MLACPPRWLDGPARYALARPRCRSAASLSTLACDSKTDAISSKSACVRADSIFCASPAALTGPSTAQPPRDSTVATKAEPATTTKRRRIVFIVFSCTLEPVRPRLAGGREVVRRRMREGCPRVCTLSHTESKVSFGGMVPMSTTPAGADLILIKWGGGWP